MIEAPSNQWSNQDKRVKFSVTDNVAVQSVRIETNLGGTDLQPAQDGTYSCNLLSNGSYNIVATDTNGNQSILKVICQKIDKVPPYFYDVEDGDIITTSLPYTLRFNDDNSGMSGIPDVYKDGAIYNQLSGTDTSLTLEEEGNYIVSISDAAGNSTSVSFSLDEEPTIGPPIAAPMIDVDPIPTTWTNTQTTVTFKVTKGSENLEKVTVAGRELTLTADGRYSFVVDENGFVVIEATDTIGLKSSETVNINNIDKTAPSITGATEGESYTESITLSVQDNLSGIKTFLATKDERTINATINSAGNVTFADVGAYVVTVTDYAGNSSVLRFSIEEPPVVDTEGPEISFNLATTNFTNKDLPVVMTVTDVLSGVKQVRVDGEIIEPVSGKYLFDVHENGIYLVYAIDNADNESSLFIEITNIDKERPEITLNRIVEDEETVTYNITITDDLSGVKSYSIIKDGQNYNYTLGSTITEAGVYKFTAEDYAGNTVSKTFIITAPDDVTEIDTEGPLITIDKGEDWTNKSNVVKVMAYDNSGIAEVRVDDVIVPNGSRLEYFENGIHTVVAIDQEGNESTTTFEIDNIDKEAPYSTNIEDGAEYDAPVVVDMADDISGISTYRLYLNGKRCNGYDLADSLTEPGRYILQVYDYAGNNVKINFTIKSTDSEDDPDDDYNNHGMYDHDFYTWLDPIWDDFWDDEFPQPGTNTNTTNTTNTTPSNIIHPTIINEVPEENVVENTTIPEDNTTIPENTTPHEPPPENVEYEDITFGGTIHYHYVENGYPGDIMPVDLSFENLVIENCEGVETFESYLRYNTDIYEPVTIDNFVTENGYIVIEETGIRLRVFDVTNATLDSDISEAGLYFNSNPSSGNQAKIVINFPAGVKVPSKIFRLNFKLKDNAQPGTYEDAIVFDKVTVSSHHVMSNELEFNLNTIVLGSGSNYNNSNNGSSNGETNSGSSSNGSNNNGSNNNGSSNNGSSNNGSSNGGTSNNGSTNNGSGSNGGSGQPSGTAGSATTSGETKDISANFKGKGSDNTTAKAVLPATGKGIRIMIMIAVLIMISRFLYRKLEDYRDVD